MGKGNWEFQGHKVRSHQLAASWLAGVISEASEHSLQVNAIALIEGMLSGPCSDRYFKDKVRTIGEPLSAGVGGGRKRQQ